MKQRGMDTNRLFKNSAPSNWRAPEILRTFCLLTLLAQHLSYLGFSMFLPVTWQYPIPTVDASRFGPRGLMRPVSGWNGFPHRRWKLEFHNPLWSVAAP